MRLNTVLDTQLFCIEQFCTRISATVSIVGKLMGRMKDV